MSSTSVTEEQLLDVEQALAANENDPAAVWALLRSMGQRIHRGEVGKLSSAYRTCAERRTFLLRLERVRVA